MYEHPNTKDNPCIYVKNATYLLYNSKSLCSLSLWLKRSEKNAIYKVICSQGPWGKPFDPVGEWNKGVWW